MPSSRRAGRKLSVVAGFQRRRRPAIKVGVMRRKCFRVPPADGWLPGAQADARSSSEPIWCAAPLNDDHPAFSRVLADLVDLEAHLVLGALYAGAKVLVGRAVQRGAEHDAALIQLVP